MLMEILAPLVIQGLLLSMLLLFFTFNSIIGRVAKPALELAVKDVNSNETLLNGTKLKLTMVDSNCNVFVGTAEGLQTNVFLRLTFPLFVFTKKDFDNSGCLFGL